MGPFPAVPRTFARPAYNFLYYILCALSRCGCKRHWTRQPDLGSVLVRPLAYSCGPPRGGPVDRCGEPNRPHADGRQKSAPAVVGCTETRPLAHAHLGPARGPRARGPTFRRPRRPPPRWPIRPGPVRTGSRLRSLPPEFPLQAAASPSRQPAKVRSPAPAHKAGAPVRTLIVRQIVRRGPLPLLVEFVKRIVVFACNI